MAEKIQSLDELIAWREQRKLYGEVVAAGERVQSTWSPNSRGQWFAWDHGKGVVTEGAFTCAALACPGDVGLIAHIAADRHPASESGNNSFPALVDALLAKKVNSLHVFGLKGKLLSEIVQYLHNHGIRTVVHINNNLSEAYTIVIKGNQMQFWTE